MFYTTEDTGDEIIEIDFKNGPESELAKKIDKEVQEKDAKSKIKEKIKKESVENKAKSDSEGNDKKEN